MVQPTPKDPNPNRVREEVEQAVLDHALEAPKRGAQRVADELLLKGIQVSSGDVRGMWDRLTVSRRSTNRCSVRRDGQRVELKLSEEQIQALDPFSPEFRGRHIEVHYTGDLVAWRVEGRGQGLSADRALSIAGMPGAGPTRASCRSPPSTS